MCSSCTQAFSGLVAGIISLIWFILFPMIQIFLASMQIIFEKIFRKA